MIRVPRLISSPFTMSTTICVVAFVSICSLSTGHDEDITRNLVRDPVELGNPYPVQTGAYHYGGHQVKRRPHHNRQPVDGSSFSASQAVSASDEESLQPPRNTIPRDDRRPSAIASPTLNHGFEGHSETSGSTEEPEEDCALCAASRHNAQVSATLDDDTLRAVRVEMIKQQILKKLRLKEPPKVDHVPKGQNTVFPPIMLGNPVLSNDVRGGEEDNDISNMDMEDFYGKTEQIIVLPQDVIPNCAKWGTQGRMEAASCFIFNLPNEVRSNQISTADLWVYKLSDVTAEEGSTREPTSPHTFTISEIVTVTSTRSSRRRPSIRFNPINTREDIPETAGWVNFNMTDVAHTWLETNTHDHTIQISCSTCSKDLNEFPFDSTGEQQPFIVFNIANGKRRRRSRRSINCSPGITECCRESLYISFGEIKWDWVIEPKGFDAYYCKGKCHGDAALAHSATRHSSLMIDVVKNRGGVNNKTVELLPCCTATQMTSISLLYRDSQSYNTTIQKVQLPNMVIQSCGCK